MKNKRQGAKNRYWSILQDAMDGFWLTDIHGNLLEVNESYCRMSGYGIDELLSLNIADLEATEIQQDVHAHIQEIIKKGSGRFETQHRRKDGMTFDVEISAQFRREEGGRLVYFLRDISEHKSSAKNLIENEAKLKSTLAELSIIHKNVPVALLVVDRDRRVQNANEFAANFAQRFLGEMIGLRGGEALRCLHHRDDSQGCGFGPACSDCKVRKAVMETFETQTNKNEIEAWLPFEKKGKKEELCFLINTAYLHFDGVEKVLLCAQDITERKKNEITLQKSETKFRESTKTLKEAQTVAKIGSWWYDPATKMLTWTEEMFHIFGLEPQPEALPYDEHRKIIHPEDWERFDAAVTQAVTSGIGYNLELKITRPSGEIAYINARCEVEKKKSGEVIRLIGTTQDITDRKLAAIDLRKSEKKYRYLFENMAQGAFYQSSEGHLLDVNSAALEIFGLRYDQFIGKTSMDFQWKVIREDGSDFPGEAHPSMFALNTGKPCKDVVAGIYNAKDNAYRWVTINAVPQFEENQNRPYQVFVTMHDITVRKQSEDLQRIQYDLSYRLQDVNTLEQGLGICLTSALDASCMTAGGIYLTNEETGGVELISHKGLPDDFLDQVRYYESDSDNVKLLKEKRALYMEYDRLDIPKKEAEKTSGFKAICIIPIFYQDNLLGCINLTSSAQSTVPRFSRVAIETIAHQIGNWVNYNKTKQILRESENRFSLAMEAAQDGLYDWDLRKNTIYFSPGWKRMLGYENFELPNDFSIWEKLTAPEDVKRSWKMQQELVNKERDRFELEFKMRHKDGRWIDILSRATAVFDKNDNAVRIVGTHIDITERKKNENELFVKNNAIENSLNAFDIVDEHGKFLYVNPSYVKMWGYDGAEEIVGTSSTSHCVVPDKPKKIIQKLKEKGAYELELAARKKDGSHFDVLMSAWLAHDENGSEIYPRTSIDITERKRTEKKLRRSKELFKKVFNSQVDAILILNAEIPAKVVQCNKAVETIFGYTNDELISAEIKMFHVDDNHQRQFQKDLFASIEQGILFKEYEFVMKRKDGTTFPSEHTVLELNNKRGARTGWLSIIRDISEKKELEQKIFQAQKMESIGALAGGIAHDFNNLLSPIIGYTEMLEDDLPVGSPLRENVQKVLIGAGKAKELVKQILIFSRQDESVVNPIKPHLVIKEAVNLVKSIFPSNIDVRTNIRSDTGIILADPTQIHQIVMNLMANAYQSMQQGGGQLTIELKNHTGGINENPTGSPPGKYVKLTIADTGTGIDQKIIHNIFDPYFSTKPADKGTGLGLSVVYGIVQKYKGDITVDSIVGKGTKFQVLLPVSDAAQKDDFLVKDKVELEYVGIGRVLLVDDDEAILSLGKKILERIGYTVDAYTSSRTALSYFKSSPTTYDIVITDMTMPKMDGDELTREIKRVSPDLPVIICTGFSEAMTPERAQEIGASKLLLKPISKADLTRALKEIFEFSN